MNRPSLHVLWMYPDVLHLHGDRGNVMALRHVAGLMGICLLYTSPSPRD